MYFFREPGERHCYWDVCDCGDCFECDWCKEQKKEEKAPTSKEDFLRKPGLKPDPLELDADAGLSIPLEKKILPCYKPILKWVKKQKWKSEEERQEYLEGLLPPSLKERKSTKKVNHSE